MRIKCQHGFFIFEEFSSGQISDYISLTGFSIVPWQGFYTFESISEVPSFTLQGKNFLGTLATKDFEGTPWDLFRANNLVYDFTTDQVVNIQTITRGVQLSQAGNRYISPGLILPGSITNSGQKISNYSAWYSRDTQRYLYSEVDFV